MENWLIQNLLKLSIIPKNHFKNLFSKMKSSLSIFLIGLLLTGQFLNAQRTKSTQKSSIGNSALSISKIGVKIQGDFNGDGKTEFAIAKKVKERQGNPVENGTPDVYEIQFSDPKIKPILANCCDIRLINEGDLNNNGTDEISVYQSPINGCTYSMTTYSIINGKWKKIVDTFLIPTGCETLNDYDLQKRIFKENNTIYYLDTDMTTENSKLVKKKSYDEVTEN